MLDSSVAILVLSLLALPVMATLAVAACFATRVAGSNLQRTVIGLGMPRMPGEKRKRLPACG